MCDYIYDSSNNDDKYYILDKQNCGYYGEEVIINGTSITVGYVRVMISEESIPSGSNVINKTTMGGRH